MSVKTSQILERRLKNETIDRLQKIFNHCTNDLSLIHPIGTTCTINGIQTKNIVHLIDNFCLSDLSEGIDVYVNQYYGNNISSYEFIIDHMHFIKYEKDGYQLAHTHHEFEDHSFIVYLNDSDAVTKIYHNDCFSEIRSVKNNYVIFDSSLYHESTKCSGDRFVLVGSIKFRNKIWKIATH